MSDVCDWDCLLSWTGMTRSDWITIVATLIAMAVGALITWHLAKRATQDLTEHAKMLKHLIVTLARALEQHGLVDLAWREGELTGIQIHLAAKMEGRATAHGNLASAVANMDGQGIASKSDGTPQYGEELKR